MSQITENNNYPLPSESTMKHACKFAIVDDKPIMMDYWVDSLEKKATLGVYADKKKRLVKTDEEYTSYITKLYKMANEYIIITENSIYIVSVSIPSKNIS